MGEQFCRDHRCVSRQCHHPRIGTSLYCPYHQCRREGCEMEAGSDGYCGDHQRLRSTCYSDKGHILSRAYPTYESGESLRRPCSQSNLKTIKMTTAMADYSDTCKSTIGIRGLCGRRSVEGSSFCSDHICDLRPCTRQRARNFQYCHNHKCGDFACPRPQRGASTMMGTPELRHRTSSTTISEYGSTAPPFCDMHSCRRTGCCEPLKIGARSCAEHMRCRAPGCGRIMDAEGPEIVLCWEHRQRERDRERDFERMGHGGRWHDYGLRS